MHEHINLSRSELIELSLKKENTWLSSEGALCAFTGKHKGRAANDKFIVFDDKTKDCVNWKSNKSFSKENFNKLHDRIVAYLQDKDVYAQYLFAGTEIKLPFKLVTTSPRHAAFSTNMFYEFDNHNVQFEILHVPDFEADPKIDNTNSEAFIIISFSERKILIGGTSYSGEIKKAVFTAMNFILPQIGVLPMHASVNEEKDQDNSCIFFGLSGTGKTTLSADPNRILIGDDEHGWSLKGLFNFENGCYAKTIKLNKADEPQIWKAINKFGSILENVSPVGNGELDFNSDQFGENTRGSYRLSAIENSSKTRTTGHPKNVIMLTYDSFGVLPLVSKLSIEQSCAYFINGFTSKVAGTESGVTKPVATFSACFGEPFLPLSPAVYTSMLIKKLRKHNVNVFLVNTGLVGGPYGVGKRVSITKTRKIISAILNGTLSCCEYSNDNPFNLNVPCLMDENEYVAFNPAPNEFIKEIGCLNPIDTWEDKEAYYAQANMLIKKFKENFAKYEDDFKKIKDLDLVS